MKRIGLFGGTFNPIHLGHLRTAVEVGEKLSLDVVFLIPSALPPHKDSTALISAEDRLAMARIAVEGSGLFQVSDVELMRSGPSYTIDTVRYFKSCFGDAALFLIVGADAFLELDTWKDYQTLLDEIRICRHDPARLSGRGKHAGCHGRFYPFENIRRIPFGTIRIFPP